MRPNDAPKAQPLRDALLGVKKEDDVAEAISAGPDSRLWLALASQKRKLGLAARKLLAKGGQLALKGVPDLSLDAMLRLAHAALLSQGAESWTAPVAGHRVHRYAFQGRRKG